MALAFSGVALARGVGSHSGSNYWSAGIANFEPSNKT